MLYKHITSKRSMTSEGSQKKETSVSFESSEAAIKTEFKKGKRAGDDLQSTSRPSYVSAEIWNSWSPIRRESFSQMLQNPNSFFYRNRPPGDPQKYGQFTEEEKEQFLKRVEYFRNDLKIEDGLWGLFSVPIRGRLGYQCSNFYRQLIKEKKIIDNRYEIGEDGKLQYKHGQTQAVSKESMEILQKEAADFIEKCMRSEDGETPKLEKPIRVISSAPKQKQETKKKERAKPEVKAEPKPTSEPVIEAKFEPEPYQEDLSDGLSWTFGRSRKLPERNFKSIVEISHQYGGKNGPSRKDRRRATRGHETNPLVGVIDPMSGDPIQTPMIDYGGYVMDLSSWRLLFKHYLNFQGPTVAASENDLTEVTGENYDYFKLLIRNFPV